MNEDCQKVGKDDAELRLDEDLVCDVCGRYGAFQAGDRQLCPECYTGSGSCCPEFGKDDLWEFEEELRSSDGVNRPMNRENK